MNETKLRLLNRKDQPQFETGFKSLSQFSQSKKEAFEQKVESNLNQDKNNESQYLDWDLYEFIQPDQKYKNDSVPLVEKFKYYCTIFYGLHNFHQDQSDKSAIDDIQKVVQALANHFWRQGLRSVNLTRNFREWHILATIDFKQYDPKWKNEFKNYSETNGVNKLKESQAYFLETQLNFKHQYSSVFGKQSNPDFDLIKSEIPSLSKQKLDEIYENKLKLGSHLLEVSRLNQCLIFDILTYGKLFTEEGIDHLYLMEEFDQLKHQQRFFMDHYKRFFQIYVQNQNEIELKKQLQKLSVSHKVKFFYFTHKYLNWLDDKELFPRDYIRKNICRAVEERIDQFSRQQVLDIFEGLSLAQFGSQKILNSLMQRIYECIDQDLNKLEQIDWLTLKVILTLSPKTYEFIDKDIYVKIIDVVSKKIWKNLDNCNFGQYSKCFINMESIQILFLLSLNLTYMTKIADDKIKEFFFFEQIQGMFSAEYLFSVISQDELFLILNNLQAINAEKNEIKANLQMLAEYQELLKEGKQCIIDEIQLYQNFDAFEIKQSFAQPYTFNTVLHCYQAQLSHIDPQFFATISQKISTRKLNLKEDVPVQLTQFMIIATLYYFLDFQSTPKKFNWILIDGINFDKAMKNLGTQPPVNFLLQFFPDQYYKSFDDLVDSIGSYNKKFSTFDHLKNLQLMYKLRSNYYEDKECKEVQDLNEKFKQTQKIAFHNLLIDIK
eukprot:403371568